MNYPTLTETLEELHNGSFMDKLSIAMKQTVQGLLIREKSKGKITITLKFERINDTDMVNIDHRITYEKPTLEGGSSEFTEGETFMFMHLNGNLTVDAPDREIKEPGTVTSFKGKR